MESIDHNSTEIIQDLNHLRAKWWERVIGFGIDWIIVKILVFIIYERVTYKSEILDLYWYSWHGELYWCFWYSVYVLIFELEFNKTVGKFLLKTKVVDSRYLTKPKFSQILLRTLCRFIPFESWSFLASRPFGWHDSIPKIMVVRVEAFNKLKLKNENSDQNETKKV